MQNQQGIVPFLSFTSQAEQAARFYVSVFPGGKIIRITKAPEGEAVLTVEFELQGLKFISLNTGQDWKFSEATSFAFYCDTQEEIDRLWQALLSDGGRELSCAWVQDKFGMFWQIVPSQLNVWLESGDAGAIARMFQSMWQMTKLDIAALQAAFDGG